MTRSKAHIPAALRKRVATQARHRCGYCLRSEEVMGMPMTLDHIIPESVGGPTTEDNLWLACNRCNEFKGKQSQAIDSQTGELIPLFNPRLQRWDAHFAWSEDSTHILGRTPTGRATITALQMNNPEIVIARRLWASAGWWPPQD